MTNEITKADIEEIINKLKGIDFLVNGMTYLTNYNEEDYINGVFLVSENIKSVITDIKNMDKAI